MGKCYICKNNLTLHYGDNILGDNFCKDCYEKYRCLYCNKLNIEILFDKDHNISEILIKKNYGGTVCKGNIVNSLLEPGFKFELYCKECWDSQDMYNYDSCDESVEPDEDDDEYYDEEYDEDEENMNDEHDLYYAGKGKYDLY